MLRALTASFAMVAGLLVVAPASPASAAEIRTCVSYEGAETDCWDRPRWRYEFCYDRPPKRAFLQQYVDGEWRLVMEKKLTRDSACPPDYPWELRASRKIRQDGVRNFRWVLQYGSMYQDMYENFTVSRTSR